MMRERNLYLEKCRQVEDFGESQEWGADDSTEAEQKLMFEVYEILYNEK